MATFINVTSGGDGLLNKVKQQQQTARLAHGEKSQRQALASNKANQATDAPQGKALPPLPYRRDPAASRSGGAFMAFVVQASVSSKGRRVCDDLAISLGDQQIGFLDFSPIVYWADAKLIGGQYYFGYVFSSSGSGARRLLDSRFFQTAPPAIQEQFEALSPEVLKLPSHLVKKKPLLNDVTILSAAGLWDSGGEIYSGFYSKAEYGQTTWTVPQGDTRVYSVPWWGRVP